MRFVLLLLAILVAVDSQLIKQNIWKANRGKKHEGSDLINIFCAKRGSAIIFEGSNLLTIVLLHPLQYENRFQFGGKAVTIKIDFGSLNPQNYGKVDGQFNVSISHRGKEWFEMGEISYFGDRIQIGLKGWHFWVQTVGAAYIWLILLSICQAGINILLLTVILKRKRWSQVQPLFLMVIMGWQIKKVLIFWFQCSFFFPNEDNCSCVVVMKYLLIILSIKSLKILVQVLRISNNILNIWRVTLGMAIATTLLMYFLSMFMLHMLVPLSFFLQFRKYSRYSRLDFELHYSIINLNLFLNSQLLYRLLTYHSSISTSNIILAIYSVLCVAVATIMGELYQYSPQNNRSSPCLKVDFDNKRFCPYCQEELYEQEAQQGSKNKERGDLCYDLWKFGVGECGHLFHLKCMRELLGLRKGCPLINQLQQLSICKPQKYNLCEQSKIN